MDCSRGVCVGGGGSGAATPGDVIECMRVAK